MSYYDQYRQIRQKQRTPPRRKMSNSPSILSQDYYQQLTNRLWQNTNDNEEDDEQTSVQAPYLETKRAFQYLNNKERNPLTSRDLNRDTRDIQYYKDENHKLKQKLIQLKLEMKSQIEQNLMKQKQELKVIMKEYVEFIDKILLDKKQLKMQLEEYEQRPKFDGVKVGQFIILVSLINDNRGFDESKFYGLLQENQQLNRTVQLLQNENSQIRDQCDEIDHKLVQLEQLLMELEMEKQQANQAVDRMRSQIIEIKSVYERRIQEINSLNEQEFIKFERIVAETLKKKDSNIQKLKMAVEALRNGFDS